MKHSHIVEGPLLPEQASRYRSAGALVYPLATHPNGRVRMFYGVWSQNTQEQREPLTRPRVGIELDGIIVPVTLYEEHAASQSTIAADFHGVASFPHPWRHLIVLVWARSYDSGRHFITVALSNGCVRADVPGPVNAAFRFSTLRILAENEYVQESFTAVPSLFPARAIFVRDFHLHGPEEGSPEVPALRARWRNPPEYREFGPAALPLPMRADRDELWEGSLEHTASLFDHVGVTRDGEPVAHYGPWPMIGNREPYAFGGSGIRMGIGFQGHPAAPWYACLCARLHAHRQRKALHGPSGEPIWPTFWTAPIEYDLSSARSGPTAEIPYFGDAADLRLSTPDIPARDHEEDLLDHRPHDGAHLRRITSYLEEAWWLAGDHFSRWMIGQLAADVSHGEWSARGKEPFTAPEGTWVPHSAQAKLAAVQTAGPGGWYGREFGWVLDILSAALQVSSRRGLVQGHQRRHLIMLLHLFRTANTPWGIPQLAWWQDKNALIPQDERGAQSFEFAILLHGVVCALRSAVWEDSQRRGLRDEVLAQLFRGAMTLYLDTPPVPTPWGGSFGPPGFVSLQKTTLWLDPPLPGYAKEAHQGLKGDSSHVWHAIASLSFLLPRPDADQLLAAGLEQWVPHRSLSERLAWISAAIDPEVRSQAAVMEALLAGMVLQRRLPGDPGFMEHE